MISARLCIGLQPEIGIFHRPLDSPVERNSKQVHQAKVLPSHCLFVVQRCFESGNQTPPLPDIPPEEFALGLGQGRDVGKDQ